MENIKRLLEKHPFFEGLEERWIELLAGCATNVNFEEGAFILRQGEAADRLIVIRQGRVVVEIDSPGRGPITIQTLGKGDILGWSWLVPPYCWCYDARVLEKTRAISFDTKCLRDKCDKDHSLGYDIFKRLVPVIGQRMQAATMQLVSLYGEPDI